MINPLTGRAYGKPHPAVAAVRNAVRPVFTGPPATALVACSGGADSLALASAAQFVGQRQGWRIGAVVVDHGLQPGSAPVCERAAGQLRGLGLGPVEVVTVRVEGPGGPEAAARDARYQALEEAAARHRAAMVLLGHHRDDQAESVLLALARGSGTRALAGIPPRREIYRRPLLGLNRKQLVAACQAEGLDWWEDPTNMDTSLRRNRVRHEVLPFLEEALGPGVAANLARTADLARQDADALDVLAEVLFQQALAADDHRHDDPAHDGHAHDDRGGVSVDARMLEEALPALRTRVLRRAAREAGAGALNGSHVRVLDSLVTQWHGQDAVPLPGRVSVRRMGGTLHFLADR